MEEFLPYGMSIQHILQAMLATPVIVTGQPDKTLADFEKSHCFFPELQPANTAQYLTGFTSQMKPLTIYIMREPLRTVKIMLFLGEKLVIIGPYFDQTVTMGSYERILAGLGIPASYMQPYSFYSQQYSVVETDIALRAVAILIEGEGLLDNHFDIRRIDIPWQKPDTEPLMGLPEFSSRQVEARYLAENRLMQCVAEGNANGAKEALAEMSQHSSGVQFVSSRSWNINNGLTILRSTIRIAAKASGLPPVKIDAISQRYASELYSGVGHSSHGDTNRLTEKFIEEICAQIRRHKSRRYSPVVLRAVSYIEVNLGQNITVQNLAQELGVSSGHLSKQFKADTGTTIMNYIMDARTAKAAELLLTTNHPVQDISSYVGYQDNNYFVKVFKSRYGKTPSGYRKNI